MIRFNIKLAFRNFLKNKTYSTLIISGFAIGFSACTLIVLFYSSESSVNKNFPNHENIYRLYDPVNNRCNINSKLITFLQEDYSEIENTCPINYFGSFEIQLKSEESNRSTSVKNILSTTNSFFDVFDIKVAESMATKPFDGLESIILSRSIADRLFDNQNPLGKRINVNDLFNGTVTAVIDDWPANSSFQADILMNFDNKRYRLSSTVSGGIKYNPTNIFVQFNEHTNIGGFIDNVNGFISHQNLDIESIEVQNLADIYLSSLTMKSSHLKGNPKMLRLFMAIAILIIFLSSINYLNYSVSMQHVKLKEIGINKVHGATFRNLMNSALIEVSLGVLVAMIISVAITTIFLPFSAVLFGKQIFLSTKGLMGLLPVFLVAMISVILLNSFIPIYFISRFNITDFLGGLKVKRSNRQLGRQSMFTFQLVASIALIISVLVIFKQLDYVKKSDFGFDTEQLLRIDIPNNFKKGELLREELEKLTFVESSALSSGYPGMIWHRMGSNIKDNSFTLNCIPVGDDYLKTMGIELLEGRPFYASDNNKVCLINTAAFKQYGWESIEGNKFNNMRSGGYDVIGIVNDFNVKSFHSKIEPMALIYSNEHVYNSLSVRFTPGNLSQQIDQIKSVWKKFSPYELSFTFYDDHFQTMYKKEEKLAGSITFFSIVALVLTCMGILGQIFMNSLMRTKEIGIRKVNGAKVFEILTILNKDFAKWVAMAFVIACPIAWYAMSKWLENFAYKTELSWWIFVLAGFIALAITLITVSWQSWRAARCNPIDALRYE